jgi:hypothetical protein
MLQYCGRVRDTYFPPPPPPPLSLSQKRFRTCEDVVNNSVCFVCERWSLPLGLFGLLNGTVKFSLGDTIDFESSSTSATSLPLYPKFVPRCSWHTVPPRCHPWTPSTHHSMSSPDLLVVQRTPLTLGIVNITNSVRVKRVSEYEYQEAGVGGSADILWYVTFPAMNITGKLLSR